MKERRRGSDKEFRSHLKPRDSSKLHSQNCCMKLHTSGAWRSFTGSKSPVKVHTNSLMIGLFLLYACKTKCHNKEGEVKLQDFPMQRIQAPRVWRSYNECNRLDAVDSVIKDSGKQHEVFQVIHIGLLCMQEYLEDRPNMSSTFRMLTSNAALPSPEQPGFFSERRNQCETDSY
ncbi:hypothetical protein POM88_010561 [Heracleum sosnowskyi]|uniref:Uncharacterized protein n=1 Tax=Heracleum sosnowskyi TaxID=360622 RepID=A0AAD8ITD2_9APIA|nr:hypothetical protein POM88_010561 [Heracleum sosnowskyi]